MEVAGGAVVTRISNPEELLNIYQSTPAAAALVGVFAGLLLCRRRKQQAGGSVKSKDYPVNDTPTLAGETCEETTIEFEHRSRTASENAQSEFGLSTHFEEEQDASGLSDRNSDTNMFDITNEMETMALFQKPLEESIVEEQSKSRTSDQPPTPSTTAHSENEKSQTPPISVPPPPTSSAPDDEFDEYEYELETLESSSRQEAEKLVASSSGRFSGALEGDESAKEDVFLIGDVDSEEEEEVPVRVIDMIKRFG